MTIVRLILWLGVGVLACRSALSCGTEWTKPKSHFDAVDYRGNIFLVETLGQIGLGKDLAIPIYATFEPGAANKSPYAGRGWTVPLLESKMVQIDENTFKLDQPDGWCRFFWRDPKNPNVLNGQGGWKAEVKGGLINAWASCGDKMSFSNGRIVGMNIKGRQFDYVYEDGIIRKIQEGGTAILSIKGNSTNAALKILQFADGKSVVLENGQCPVVQVVNGQSLVAGVDQSLTKVIHADSSEDIYEYSVDHALNPQIKKNDRELAWDPVTGIILRDGDWTYSVTRGKGRFDNSEISRSNTLGQTEAWFFDGNKGREITKSLDGSTKTVEWFTSGNLAGKIRQAIIKGSDGKDVIASKVSYDEMGEPLRGVKQISDSVTQTFEPVGDHAVKTVTDFGGGVQRVTIKENGKVVDEYKLINGEKIELGNTM